MRERRRKNIQNFQSIHWRIFKIFEKNKIRKFSLPYNYRMRLADGIFEEKRKNDKLWIFSWKNFSSKITKHEI